MLSASTDVYCECVQISTDAGTFLVPAVNYACIIDSWPSALWYAELDAAVGSALSSTCAQREPLRQLNNCAA